MQPCARLTDLFVVSCPDPTLASVTILKWLMAFCCCAYVGKCDKGFVWSDQREKLTYVKPKDAWRHRHVSASMKRFTGLSDSLSFQPRSIIPLCTVLRHSSTHILHCHKWQHWRFPEKPHKLKEFFEFPSYENIVAIILALQQTHWKNPEVN